MAIHEGRPHHVLLAITRNCIRTDIGGAVKYIVDKHEQGGGEGIKIGIVVCTSFRNGPLSLRFYLEPALLFIASKFFIHTGALNIASALDSIFSFSEINFELLADSIYIYRFSNL